MNETIEFTLRKDPLYQQAVDLIIESKRISPSYLQRRLKISYRRAELLCSAVIESLMAKYSDHIATSGKMIALTVKAAQQIEEALEDIVRVFKFETGTPVEALAVIRAAKAHANARSSIRSTSEYSEQAEQEPLDDDARDNMLLWMIQRHFPSLPLSDEHTDWGRWLGFANAVFEAGRKDAVPVRTKDLTDAELDALWHNTKGGWIGLFRAVIAADRELNK